MLCRRWSPTMLDDFGLYPREEPFDPFSVMLFKALQVVAFLFFIALLAIAPQADEGKIESKGRVHHHHGLAGQSSRRSRSVRAGRCRKHRLVSAPGGWVHGA